MAGLSGFLPAGAKEEVKQALWSVYDAPVREAAGLLAHNFIQRYRSVYPSAVQWFQDDLDACLSHLRCPASHRKRIGTTNLLERAFLEVRRTRATPRFCDERGCLKLIFATLMEVSDKGQRIRISDLGRVQLDRLHQQLGIDEQGQAQAMSAWLMPLLLQEFLDLTYAER